MSLPSLVTPKTGDPNKRLYRFDEGDATMRDILGGKGANLAEMTRLGLPVPPGFTIATSVCQTYLELGQQLPVGLWEEILTHLTQIEQKMGRAFGDVKRPLLVSVRSGARFSMPGMMDTVLNLGLNHETVAALAAQSGDRRFALDVFRRFIAMYGNVVMGIPVQAFETVLNQCKHECGVSFDHELGVDAFEALIPRFLAVVVRERRCGFPMDPMVQLRGAIEAVFKSWNTQRAKTYRAYHRIAEDLGTAVNIQVMVFGNLGPGSGTGVAFTRNPSTGEPGLYGEYLLNAQGEDVVAGVRTPHPICDLQTVFPELFTRLNALAQILETHYRDVQDIEFTIEQGTLYLLQTRGAKRTAQAALRIATDFVAQGLIEQKEALRRIDPQSLNQLLHRRMDPQVQPLVVARGLAASPGAATGSIVFSANEAQKRGSKGEKVILVREETCPDDIHGMIHAQGVLTARGGMTSHAAVVARGMGIPCVAGCDALELDLMAGTLRIGKRVWNSYDVLTLNGSTGEVIDGTVSLVDPILPPEFERLMAWADQHSRLQVRSNADTPQDAQRALELGAKGIGLCRTEHMFMSESRLGTMRELILADDQETREAALQRLLPMQRQDFYEIFKVMRGLPVTIRLLDPPLHEFLPSIDELHAEIRDLSASGKTPLRLASLHAVLETVTRMQEFNPMMGLRGCRLGLLHPEINAMQVRAIFEAACDAVRDGIVVRPEIMIPFVGHVNELIAVKRQIQTIAQATLSEAGLDIPYETGTMIEVPRAALTADAIAREAAFFSFGTNDLTQMTYGFSRDDAERHFLGCYLQNHILEDNPFEVLDQDGVGMLMRMACELGRSTRATLQLGICGEHGGEPRSIAFAHALGLDYVSCSPYRVPIARLAAARAALGTLDESDR
jgi:pyruvate,orthophosphate dikinase